MKAVFPVFTEDYKLICKALRGKILGSTRLLEEFNVIVLSTFVYDFNHSFM